MKPVIRNCGVTPGASSFDEEYHGLADSSTDSKKAQRSWLFDVLSRLPLNLRQVLMLQLEGFDYGEMAELLGISTENVGVRLHRARQLLRELSLEEQSDEH